MVYIFRTRLCIFAYTLKLHNVIMRLQISVLYYLLLFLMNINAFHLGQTAHLSRERRGDLSMTWTFKTLDGSPLEKHGIIGSEGELFFHPLVSASINIPDEVRSAIPEILSPSLQLPVIATSKPLLPGCRDWFLSKDMNHRRLFYENAVGSDIALLPFSASQKRLGLVGVVARIESKELTDDGSCKAILHAYSRCFLLQFTNDEDPYLIAHVQRFEDFAAYLKEPTLDIIENQILQKLIINMKLLRSLETGKPLVFSKNILKYRPPNQSFEVARMVSPMLPIQAMKRRTAFSFAVIDALQISEATRIKVLQEHVIEERLKVINAILNDAQAFLKEELTKNGLLSIDQIENIIKEGYIPEKDNWLFKDDDLQRILVDNTVKL